jgi:hypothetical protein
MSAAKSQVVEVDAKGTIPPFTLTNEGDTGLSLWLPQAMSPAASTTGVMPESRRKRCVHMIVILLRDGVVRVLYVEKGRAQLSKACRISHSPDIRG